LKNIAFLLMAMEFTARATFSGFFCEPDDVSEAGTADKGLLANKMI